MFTGEVKTIAQAALARLALAGAVLGVAGCSTSLQTVAEVRPGEILFQIDAPEAKSVSVLGSFNNWNAKDGAMAKSGDSGHWTATIIVPAGRHHFIFVVDGESYLPPGTSKRASDGFGGENGVLDVLGDDWRGELPNQPGGRQLAALPPVVIERDRSRPSSGGGRRNVARLPGHRAIGAM